MADADAGVVLPPPARSPWRASVSKYAKIYRVSLIERMAYRGDFFLGTVLRFLPMLTTILLWKAIFDGSGNPGDEEQKRIADFTYREMVAYLLLVHIGRMFSSMPGLAFGITRDIREGTLKKYLLQPLDMIGYLLSYRMAHKTAYIATSAIPYGLFFLVCYDYLRVVQLDAVVFLAFLLSLILAFLIGFFFEACLGMIGFWMLEVTSLLYVVQTLNFFVSGQMFPLDLLPEPWASLMKLLPFQYLAYFPAMVILGKVQGAELVQGLAIAAVWALVLIVLTRVLYARGLRRYSAYGG